MAAPPLAATGDISIAPSDAAAAPVARDEQTQRVVEDRPVAAAEIDASAPPDDAVAHAIEEAAARPVVDTAKPVAEGKSDGERAGYRQRQAGRCATDEDRRRHGPPRQRGCDARRPRGRVAGDRGAHAPVLSTTHRPPFPTRRRNRLPKIRRRNRPPSPKPAPRSESRPASVANDAARGPAPGSAAAPAAPATRKAAAPTCRATRRKLAAHLRRYRSFPAEARDRGISGTATVRFTVNRGGAVIGASLAKSSGSGVLDQAAVAMVYRASPFPPIPSGFAAGTLTVNVPVRFDMR